MKIINTNSAPAAIGPYSQAIEHGGVIYVSGQLPVNPATGELCDGDISSQTTRVMENIRAIVEASGSDMSRVLKTTILLTDLANFTKVNNAYAAFFPENPPARACYQVSALPKGADIEIEAIVAMQ